MLWNVLKKEWAQGTRKRLFRKRGKEREKHETKERGFHALQCFHKSVGMWNMKRMHMEEACALFCEVCIEVWAQEEDSHVVFL